MLACCLSYIAPRQASCNTSSDMLEADCKLAGSCDAGSLLLCAKGHLHLAGTWGEMVLQAMQG